MERTVGGRQSERLVHVDPAEHRWQLFGRGGWFGLQCDDHDRSSRSTSHLTASAQLSFDWLIESGLDTGEYLALDFFSGSNWQEVAKLSGNVDTENTWHNEVLTIDGEYLSSNFQFRFRAKMSGSDEDANVDNVQLIGIVAADR